MTGILNIKRGYVFIHVPKTAGSSIAELLLATPGAKPFQKMVGLKDAIAEENAIAPEIVLRPPHARARDIRTVIGADVYGSIRSVAVVRNPWDRLRSTFFYQRKAALRTRDVPEHLLDTFNRFVLWTCAERPASLADRLCERDRRIVIVTDIIRYETLQADFARLARDVFRVSPELPRVNVSDRDLQEEPFSDEAIEVVRWTYRHDFDLFGYSDMPLC